MRPNSEVLLKHLTACSIRHSCVCVCVRVRAGYMGSNYAANNTLKPAPIGANPQPLITVDFYV